MKKIYAILIFFLASITYAGEINSCITIHLLNKAGLHDLSILDRDKIIYDDTLGKSSRAVWLPVKDPYVVTFLINGDIENNIPFYLHKGNYAVYIDIKNKTVSFKNSPLNNEFLFLNKVHDSITRSWHLPKTVDFRYKVETDSIYKYAHIRDSIWDRFSYNYYLHHKASYLTLAFVNTYLYCSNHPYLDRKKLKILFDKLDPGFYNYKMYKECKTIFETDPGIAKPLWNSKQ